MNYFNNYCPIHAWDAKRWNQWKTMLLHFCGTRQAASSNLTRSFIERLASTNFRCISCWFRFCVADLIPQASSSCHLPVATSIAWLTTANWIKYRTLCWPRSFDIAIVVSSNHQRLTSSVDRHRKKSEAGKAYFLSSAICTLDIRQKKK